MASALGVALVGMLTLACNGPVLGDEDGGGSQEGTAAAMTSTGTQGATGQSSQTGVATGNGDTGGSGGTVDGGSGDSTGSEPPPPCVDDAECVLVDTCDQCTADYAGAAGAPDPGARVGSRASAADAVPGLLGGAPPAFDIGPICEFTQCQLWDDPTPQCRYGHCVLSKLHCGTPACDSLPPDCAPPFVPLIDADGTCWTGSCGPAYLCDFVDSCLDCNDGTVCVTLEGQTQPTCERPPMECEGTADCACAGAALCGEAACAMTDDGGIVCGGGG